MQWPLCTNDVYLPPFIVLCLWCTFFFPSFVVALSPALKLLILSSAFLSLSNTTCFFFVTIDAYHFIQRF